MFHWMTKIAKKISNQTMPQKGTWSETTQYQHEKSTNQPNPLKKVDSHVQKNLEYLKASFGKNDAMIYRSLHIGKTVKRSALLVAVSGLVEKTMIHENVISPLMCMELSDSGNDLFGYLQESVLAVIDIKVEDDLKLAMSLILTGNAALFVEGETKALIIGVQAWEMRAIEQPVTETVVRGPRDSFNEDIDTNLTLLRRRIRHPQLRSEAMTIGTMTQTKVVICYVEGIVNEEIVAEVKKRLDNIRVDSIMESGYIEQYIEDAPFSLFPTISNSEKPDIVASKLLEGRVAIFVDGTPMVLVVPNLLVGHFQVSEDYYSRPIFANLIRLLRVLSFFTTIMLPGLYIAVQYYHPILIPFSLLVSLAKSREEVPFQVYIEVFIMLMVFEVIRESGIRMPRPIGQAVSIVGALILGEAAVDAGLVGIPVVVVVAFVGVSSFLVNSLSEAISVLRFLFVIAGATFGIYGVLILGMIVVTHLASLRSFGVPYTAPLFPLVWKDWKDAVLRFPLWMIWHRPKSLRPANFKRQKWGGMSGEGKRGKE